LKKSIEVAAEFGSIAFYRAEKMNPFELTKHLMSIPSVTGTEAELGGFLSIHLASLGYRVEQQRVEGNRFNVFAFAGEAPVVMCTHIDTVCLFADYSLQFFYYFL
jgi:acetylornithine deacetylase/succinyl-diaminopimelate desuccinylase-like protein